MSNLVQNEAIIGLGMAGMKETRDSTGMDRNKTRQERDRKMMCKVWLTKKSERRRRSRWRNPPPKITEATLRD